MNIFPVFLTIHILPVQNLLSLPDHRGVEVLGDDHYKEKMSPITETLAENVYEVAFPNF